MGLFNKKANTPTNRKPATSYAPTGLASAASLPEPSTDWTLAAVRAQWETQLESEDQALLGWRNGSHMFEQGVIPGQMMNAAEYMTRGLAYHLFVPLISDADALVTSRRVLTLIDCMPAEPAWAIEYAPRLSRLALTIIRDKGWQPTSLGGDGSVTDEVLSARPEGLVHYSARCTGIPVAETWSHFFSYSDLEPTERR